MALAMALALLLLSGWGQVHRVQHPVATAASVLDIGVHAAAPEAGHADADHGLEHEAGGSLCLLFDHLADGTAFTSTSQAPLASGPSVLLSLPDFRVATLQQLRPFDARGPPPLA